MEEILVKTRKLEIKKSLDNLSELFKRELKKNLPNFQDFYEIVKENSEGKIWFIGSSVYRPIIKKKYKRDRKD